MKKLLPLLLSASALSLSSPALAKKNSAPKGQPFQALQAQIDENSAAIAGNTQAIGDLAADADALESRVNALAGNLASLTADVLANDAELQDARDALDALSHADQQLASDLAALAAQHAADQAQQQQLLAGISAQIQQLSAELVSLGDQINTELGALRSAIAGNTSDIDGLILTVLDLSVSTTNNLAQIQALQADSAQLSANLSAQSAALADLEERMTLAETGLTHLQGLHDADEPSFSSFSGVAQNVPVAQLDGWSVCSVSRYNQYVDLPGVLAACNKANLMLACRPVGNPNLTLAAHAPRADVLHDVGRDRTGHKTANGVNWYFDESWSWGFTPEGQLPSRYSCDTNRNPGTHSLCWHTSSNRLTSGYRCGNTYLNGNGSWERVILHAD